ncbi:MAG: PQQ-binding-like beta-propeller repeat protein, partial [Propionibacteriaceae bacterium]
TSPMPGVPGDVPPVVTASNVLIRVNTSGQDLVAFTPDSATQSSTDPDPANSWVLRWRGHPGGMVLTTSVFGNVVVATTAGRQVVAFSDDGIRLWSVDLDEVVLTTPVRAAADELALVTLGGEVLVVELGSGQISWRGQPGVDVGVRPVVSAGVLTIADRSGELIGLDVSTGVELWRNELPTAQYQAAIGSVLTVVSSGDVYGVDLHTGQRLWRSGYLGIERGLTSFGDWAIVTHVGGSTAYDGAGRQVWDEPEVHAVTAHGPYLVRWGRVTADVVDGTGAVLTTFDTAEDTAGNTQQFAAGRAGVYQLDSSWRFRGWTGD